MITFESFLTLHTAMQVKCSQAQKGNKDIAKMGHVISEVQP